MDIQLPDIDGIEALLRIRAEHGARRDPGDRGLGVGDARRAAEDRDVGLRCLRHQADQPEAVRRHRAALPRPGSNAAMSAKILVVDDVALNVKLLADLLARRRATGPARATSGAEALARAGGRAARPRPARRDDARHERLRRLPRDPRRSGDTRCCRSCWSPRSTRREERAKGLDAGADDFLSKPVNQAELLARVRSLLRIKSLYDELLHQRGELAELEPNARAARRRRRAPAREGRAG